MISGLELGTQCAGKGTFRKYRRIRHWEDSFCQNAGSEKIEIQSEESSPMSRGLSDHCVTGTCFFYAVCGYSNSM